MRQSLFTTVEVAPLPFKLDFADGIVTLGSCFADEIAGRMHDGGFYVEQNPFGTLYNPVSVASALERLIDDKEIGQDDLVLHDGLWHSWHHHGSFSRPSAEETLAVCNESIHQAHAALLSARLLMVTFGTAWVYSLINSNLSVVANCHKLPPQNFTRRMMEVDGIVSLWLPLLERLASMNPQITTVMTVSPIRHMADGAHGNQLSKATLLLAVEEITRKSTNKALYYFPAYEIVLDELRDYRFYGPDMTHPSPLAADIVYDRFQQATMTPSVIQQAHNNSKQNKRKNHIPLHQ